MKRIALSATLLAASAMMAQSQTSPPATTMPDAAPPARTDSAPPMQGANSFTEMQVKTRLEDQGFSNVSGLKKDEMGVWRGSAMHAGKSVNVAVDYRGNIVMN